MVVYVNKDILFSLASIVSFEFSHQWRERLRGIEREQMRVQMETHLKDQTRDWSTHWYLLFSLVGRFFFLSSCVRVNSGEEIWPTRAAPWDHETGTVIAALIGCQYPGRCSKRYRNLFLLHVAIFEGVGCPKCRRPFVLPFALWWNWHVLIGWMNWNGERGRRARATGFLVVWKDEMGRAWLAGWILAGRHMYVVSCRPVHRVESLEWPEPMGLERARA